MVLPLSRSSPRAGVIPLSPQLDKEHQMSNCLRCESEGKDEQATHDVKVTEFKHPTYGWMKAHNQTFKSCNPCLTYMKLVTDIRIAFKGVTE